MQSAKDSFYMALRDRLASVNPNRAITLEGTAQPAIVVSENEPATGAVPPCDCFRLEFGAAQVPQSHRASDVALLALECSVHYATRGTSADGSDRGRTLAAMDDELLAICAPARVTIRDYTQRPPADLGTSAFWTEPQFGEMDPAGAELQRKATLTIYFHAKEIA